MFSTPVSPVRLHSLIHIIGSSRSSCFSHPRSALPYHGQNTPHGLRRSRDALGRPQWRSHNRTIRNTIRLLYLSQDLTNWQWQLEGLYAHISSTSHNQGRYHIDSVQNCICLSTAIHPDWDHYFVSVDVEVLFLLALCSFDRKMTLSFSSVPRIHYFWRLQEPRCSARTPQLKILPIYSSNIISGYVSS
jgi:HNH endonuclease